MITECTAVILTGGDSRRMGQDKASLLLGERSLLQHVISIVQPLFHEVIISVRQPRAEITLPQVCDDPTQRGPLAGLAAGLQRAKTPWVFVLACDMPFIEPAVIERLARFRDGHQAVVPMVQGYPQPLAAFYAASCADSVLECLNGAGKHSLRELLDKLQVRYVSEDELLIAGLQSRSFVDLDTPEEAASVMNQQGMK
jgi:molybdopterin-guanine dinucleotide biosynthesis protein A